MKDQVTRLEQQLEHSDKLRKETYIRVEKLERKIDDFYEKFIVYLANRDK